MGDFAILRQISSGAIIVDGQSLLVRRVPVISETKAARGEARIKTDGGVLSSDALNACMDATQRGSDACSDGRSDIQ